MRIFDGVNAVCLCGGIAGILPVPGSHENKIKIDRSRPLFQSDTGGIKESSIMGDSPFQIKGCCKKDLAGPRIDIFIAIRKNQRISD